MASSEQIKALIKSHIEKDDDRFQAVVLQVAAQAAKQGHGKLAEDLRVLIDEIKEIAPARKVTSIFQNKAEISGLFSIDQSDERLSSLISSPEILERIKRIILEHRQRSKLSEFGLSPRKKILLYGPPGTGKTLTASVLAGELKLPLFSVQFDTLITKYMGETAAKLRIVFDSINKVRGVYLFDEFDAIGTHRSSSNDVGEMRRILNSFLQLMEQVDSESIIIAATNNIQLLDHALFRRFDDVLEYQLPDTHQIKTLLERKLSPIGIKKIDWDIVVSKCAGLSYADIGKACEDALKSIILQEIPSELTTSVLLRHLDEKMASRR